jgi:hypothetical protein
MPTPTFTKNFKTLTSLDEVKDALDSTFNQLFDLLQTNPNIVSLLDPKAEVPSTKAGDLISDLRDDTPKLKWGDGKGNLIPFGLSSLTGEISDAQHGERAAFIEDPPGTVLFYMHPNATVTRSGFMSDTDKVKLDSLIAIPYSNAAPVSVDAAAGSAGVSTNVSRADHVHQVNVGNPVSIGTANAGGSSNNLARADHVHNHGNQTDPNLHALAIAAGNAGFLSGSDKTLLDLLNKFVGTTSNGGALPTTTEFPANGSWGFFLPAAGGVMIAYNKAGTVFARDLI